MIRNVLKKRKGGNKVIVAAYVLMTMVVITWFLLLTVSNQYKTAEDLTNINVIMRTYLLCAEAKGYLTADEVASLMDEIENCGVTNVQLSGNFAPDVSGSGNIRRNYGIASFGEEVLLRIEGDKSVFAPEEDDETFFSIAQRVEHIDKTLKGVASQ